MTSKKYLNPATCIDQGGKQDEGYEGEEDEERRIKSVEGSILKTHGVEVR